MSGSRGEGCVGGLAWEALPAPPPPQGDEPAVPGGALGAPAERVVESATVHVSMDTVRRMAYALRGRLAHGNSYVRLLTVLVCTLPGAVPLSTNTLTRAV